MKRTTKRTLSMFCTLALAALLGGCAKTSLSTPAGFASHREGRTYDFRASDGEGVVIAVRTEKNRPHGDLQYWTAALDVQLRTAGYEPREAVDVKSADGQSGRQLRYVLAVDGRELVFWVSLFVTKHQIVVVEAGGDAAFFEPKVEQVEAAIGSLQIG
jgi:hypothetical protein